MFFASQQRLKRQQSQQTNILLSIAFSIVDIRKKRVKLNTYKS